MVAPLIMPRSATRQVDANPNCCRRRFSTRQKGGHLRGVARPDPGAKRPVVAGEGQIHHQLRALRTEILGLAAPSEQIGGRSMEVVGRSVEEDQVQSVEQVALTPEEIFFEAVLHEAGRGRRALAGLAGGLRGAEVLLGVGRGQFLAVPGHGVAEVLQAEVGGAVNRLIGKLLGGAEPGAGESPPVEPRVYNRHSRPLAPARLGPLSELAETMPPSAASEPRVVQAGVSGAKGQIHGGNGIGLGASGGHRVSLAAAGSPVGEGSHRHCRRSHR